MEKLTDTGLKKEIHDALIRRHGAELQEKFDKASVAVCGLGGLGSNIAIALTRAGVGRLILVDFDRVDISNLNRQQYKASQLGMLKTDAMAENLAEILPYAEIVKGPGATGGTDGPRFMIETYLVKLTEENIEDILKDADIICEAFDNPESKATLVNTVLEKMPDKYLVAASGMAGMGSPNSIKTRKITERFYLCGDGESDAYEGMGLVSSRVMICAAHEAHTALRIIAGEIET